MSEIFLTKGKVALISQYDLQYLGRFKWYAMKNRTTFYAARSYKDILGKSHTVFMHRSLMNPQGEEIVDHIDGNGLNNRRENLRFCSYSQNKANSKKKKGCSSIYKGVFFSKEHNKWRAAITVNYKAIYLGIFKTELEAKMAYELASLKYFKEFRRLS